ncbi:hypothetical protein [Pseudoxanthomonas sp. X-1]|uniref:hypothetical protein n=1 Tax=Pseudoxanthomonas sp. X-1 TaxID=2571115 RepID=UPI00110B399F|nr:hypothetical protein [Pseudoxanthomonas sp. X-1]TMN18476.1 hypothetical protein FF950_14430 [Pseudoxanthomonas sp. X-1]UAY76022.1 hypothetical protein LAJ50_07245 [Pseudoxanthomonas sp. X-1]
MDPENNTPPADSTPPAEQTPLEAFDAGMAAAEPSIDELAPAPAQAQAEPPPGTVEANEAAAAAASAPPAAEGQPPADPPAADDTAAEVQALGLKDKAADRFRELSEERKTMAPFREALDKAGIKDAAELPKLVERAKVGEDMVNMVMETGASPEQYGKTLDYLGLLGRLGKGDTAAGEEAWKLMQGELAALAQLLGREAPGHDPLDQHRDLADLVTAGEMPRERALEVAQLRAQQAVQGQGFRLQQEQQAAQAAEQQGRTWLQQFDATMGASDPNYAAKRPMLNALVANIRQTVPPSQWPQAVQAAYASIPSFPAPAASASAAPAQPAKPPPGPMRPSGPQPSMLPDNASPMEALDFGMRQAG